MDNYSIPFCFDHIPSFKKGHIPNREHPKKSIFSRGHIPKRGHSKIGTLHLEHIPFFECFLKRAHSV